MILIIKIIQDHKYIHRKSYEKMKENENQYSRHNCGAAFAKMTEHSLTFMYSVHCIRDLIISDVPCPLDRVLSRQSSFYTYCKYL